MSIDTTSGDHRTTKTDQAIRLVDAGMTQGAAAKRVGINVRTLKRALARRSSEKGMPQCPCCLKRVERVLLPPNYIEQIWAARRKLYPQEFE